MDCRCCALSPRLPMTVRYAGGNIDPIRVTGAPIFTRTLCGAGGGPGVIGGGSTVGWSDLVIFESIENLHISVDQLNFLEMKSKKTTISATSAHIAHAAKFWIAKNQGWALRSFPFGTLRSFPF